MPARASSGAARTRLIEALIAIEAEAQRAVEEAVRATIRPPAGSRLVASEAPKELDSDAEDSMLCARGDKAIAEQHRKLRARASELRKETVKLEVELSSFKSKEVDFVQDLGRLLSDNEQKESELLARVDALTEEQRELYEASAQQEQEMRSLARELEEMDAYKVACENRVQFLMDQLVILLSSGQDCENGQILCRILADGEERCGAARERLGFFAQQLEDARQENRARAQKLSDMQVATTATHERMCALQNQVLERKLFSGLGGSSWSGDVVHDLALAGSRFSMERAVGSGTSLSTATSTELEMLPEVPVPSTTEQVPPVSSHREASNGTAEAGSAKSSATHLAVIRTHEGNTPPGSSPHRNSPRHRWLKDPAEATLQVVNGSRGPGIPPPNSPLQQPGAREDGAALLSVHVATAELATRPQSQLDKPGTSEEAVEKHPDVHVATLERQLREVFTPVRSETPPGRIESTDHRIARRADIVSFGNKSAAENGRLRPAICRGWPADYPEASLTKTMMVPTASATSVVLVSRQEPVATPVPSSKVSEAVPSANMGLCSSRGVASPGVIRWSSGPKVCSNTTTGRNSPPGTRPPRASSPAFYTSGMARTTSPIRGYVQCAPGGFLGQSRSSPLVAVAAIGREASEGATSPTIQRRESNGCMTAVSSQASPARVDVRWTAPLPSCRVPSIHGLPMVTNPPETVVRARSSETASPGPRPLSPRASSSPPGSARGSPTVAWQHAHQPGMARGANGWVCTKPASPRLNNSSSASSTPAAWPPWNSSPALPILAGPRPASRSGSPVPPCAVARASTSSTPVARPRTSSRSFTPPPLAPARDSRRIRSGRSGSSGSNSGCGWRSVSIPVGRPPRQTAAWACSVAVKM